MNIIEISSKNLSDEEIQAVAVGIANVRRSTWLATYPNEAYHVTKTDIQNVLGNVEEEQNRIVEILEKDNPDGYYLIAKDKDTIIGFCRAMKNGVEGILKAIYVLPEYQGRGIGKTFMQKALGWMHDQKFVELEVAAYNESALHFYKSFGFHKVDTGKFNLSHTDRSKSIPTYIMKMDR